MRNLPCHLQLSENASDITNQHQYHQYDTATCILKEQRDSILRTSEKSRPFGNQMLLHYIRGCVSITEFELMKPATDDKSKLRARTYDVQVQFVRKLNVILKQQRTSTWRKSATSSSVSRSRSVWTFTRARYRNITHECLERNITLITLIK